MQNDKSILIDSGTYDFTLNLYKGETLVESGTIEKKQIVAGSNTLSFLVDYISGYGDLSVTMNWTAEDQVETLKVGLFTTQGQAVEGYAAEIFTPESNTDSTEYSKSNVPSGTYMFMVEAYNSEFGKINNLYSIEYVMNGGSWITDFSPTKIRNENER